MKKILSNVLAGIFILSFISACSQKSSENNEQQADSTQTTNTSQAESTTMNLKKEAFGKMEDGREAHLYTLTNKNGMTVKITNYGGIVTSIITPDKNGNPSDVVLGFDNLGSYTKEHPYFGALVGRYGNRIAKGRFTLEGKTYKLATNNGENHLHGGKMGFDKVLWEAQEINNADAPGLKLTYVSKDGEEGYPGNLTSTVTYTLTNENELKIDYTAQTDKATPINLTNHSYFNLAAGQAENALNHVLTINADKFTEVNDNLIPTGKLPSVKGTPMDFTQPHSIGERLSQVKGGYDHNYVLNRTGEGLSLAATVYEPQTGRYMEVFTTQPGVQFYSGNFLDGSLTGKNGKKYVKHYGFCLETQHFPDSPNQTSFPTTILKPGENYNHTTTYKFSAKQQQ